MYEISSQKVWVSAENHTRVTLRVSLDCRTLGLPPSPRPCIGPGRWGTTWREATYRREEGAPTELAETEHVSDPAGIM